MGWLSKLQALAAAHTPHVLVTVIRVEGSAPREPGAKMIVLGDGTLFGTIGGGHLEQLAIAAAQAALARGESVVERFPLGPKAGQCCGGVVELFFDVLGCGPVLYVFGAGHVGQAVCRVMEGTNFSVHLIDARPEWINHPALPESVVRHDEDWDRAVAGLHFDAQRSFAVVMTHSHDDDERLIELLTQKPLRYLGLIGSKTKWARFRGRLQARGVTAAALDRVHCPLGLDLGDAKAPQEVAISLAAELVRLTATPG